MNFYKLDYTIEKILKDVSAPEQTFVEEYLNADLPEREAKYLWKKIVDHKWYISERLKRDIGFRVAAIDYIENFYEPMFFVKHKTGLKNSLRDFFRIIARSEFLRPRSL
jgi:Domain of unknown function (DUF4032)